MARTETVDYSRRTCSPRMTISDTDATYEQDTELTSGHRLKRSVRPLTAPHTTPGVPHPSRGHCVQGRGGSLIERHPSMLPELHELLRVTATADEDLSE
ncbi:hypothetical protein J6590_028295 [Homalodisca vitripennis]|nr:hypothetical protein J6590_028295 [Homalodisca vitripennis]